MNSDLAEKLVRQLSEAIAAILPTLEPDQIQPETRAAISKLLFAIGKFVENAAEQEHLDNAIPRLQSTALDESKPQA